MKSLYFHAHVGALQAVAIRSMMLQVDETMQPFNRYLGQSIQIAQKRQTLYALPWERVHSSQTVDIEPMDSRVLVPRRPAGWLAADWPPGAAADLASPVMVPLRDLQLTVLDYQLDAAGLHLVLDEELDDDDMVFWCGRQCQLTREAAAPPPVTVTNRQGEPLRMTRPPEQDEEGWILVLADWSGPGTLVVDGAEVPAAQLPPTQGLRTVHDTAGAAFEVHGSQLTAAEQPADGPLTGDNGIRYRWSAAKGRRDGRWLQLLLPPGGGPSYDFLDPRAAFCDGEASRVWTQPRFRDATVIEIERRDPDKYQLRVDQWPPDGSLLYLPIDVSSLELQQRAVHQLINNPLPHHQGLLRLCQDPATVFWPPVTPVEPPRWAALTDLTRSGTDEQREFVTRALGSPDLMMLEGPPGSGKTTVICELVQQLVAAGKRVLLCASTHVAIDNVLERLIDADPSIYPVRIGQAGRVDQKVQDVQLDNRVEALVDTWQRTPHLQELGGDLKAMATDVVVAAANLTCGTTMGIMSHPLLAQARRNRREPLTKMPHWDVLIVDEASKTLIQEFLVPALLAQRWVIVGDIQQLPPFNERADIEANLRALADSTGREVFPADHQRACLLRHWLAASSRRPAGGRWLIVEPPGVLDWLGAEFAELLTRGDPVPAAVRVVAQAGIRPGPFREVTVDQLRSGDPAALALLACDLVLVADDLLPVVAGQLPAGLLQHADLTRGTHAITGSHPLLFQHAWWLDRSGKLSKPYPTDRGHHASTFAEAERYEQRWLATHDLASELAWRLTRLHELKHSADQRQRDSLSRDLAALRPAAVDIEDYIGQFSEIGFPSILEVLQEGISGGTAERRSALTQGLGRQAAPAFQARFGSLSYQHRMHPDISAFPRDLVYHGQSLLDANTIAARDQTIGWTFGPFPPGRRAWKNVNGYADKGENAAEIAAMADVVRQFLSWAAYTGAPPGRGPAGVWEVALLAFYQRQSTAIGRMLAKVTGDEGGRTRFHALNVEIVSGTVDRFQGREADLVLLSMCNTARVGFLDSRNRLNVAITRARQQLLIFGKAQYFSGCHVPLLRELVLRSADPDLWQAPRAARGARPPARVPRAD